MAASPGLVRVGSKLLNTQPVRGGGRRASRGRGNTPFTRSPFAPPDLFLDGSFPLISILDGPAGSTRDDLLAQLSAMQGRLVSLAVIEQATGALMVTYGLTADEAFALLRFHSQTRNVKLRAIAAQLTSTLLPTTRRAAGPSANSTGSSTT